MFLYSTNITDVHADYLAKKLNSQLRMATSQDELNFNIQDTLSRVYTSAYTPIMVRRYLSGIPKLDDINETIEECVCDIESINKEHMNIAESIKTHFNERQNQKNSMIDRIKTLNNTIDDAMFINDQLAAGSTMIFRDSFNNSNNVDITRIEGLPVEISNKEGVVRLNVTNATNLGERVILNRIEGTGEAGNVHMVDINIDTQKNTTIKYQETTGDDPKALFDDDPSTYYEYSIVGVNETDKQKALYYDIDWAKATKTDPLRVRILLEIDSEEVINMIDVVPYFHKDQVRRLKLISIKGSLNAIDYFSIFDGPIVINPDLNIKPDSYDAQNMYLKNNSLKLAGTGVFVFKPTKTKYIEIILEQEQPFNTKIGHTVYNIYPVGQEGSAKRVRRVDVPKYAQEGDFVKSVSPDGKTTIDKSIEVFDGWKFSIAMKDIGIYKFEHAATSELLSVKYSTGDPNKNTGKPIRKLLLETDELIPEEFTAKINKRNNFIEYFVSFNDTEWIPISPSQRMPFGSETLPPKLIEINPIRASINSAVNASKYSYESKNPVYSFRLRAILRRPTEGIDLVEFFSPILEEYRVKVELEE